MFNFDITEPTVQFGNIHISGEATTIAEVVKLRIELGEEIAKPKASATWQLQKIKELAKTLEADLSKTTAFYKVKKLSDISFSQAMTIIQQMEEKNAN